MTHNYRPLTSAPTRQAVTLQQAVENSAALGRLSDLVKDSSARLKAIEPLIPEALRGSIKAGPIDGDTWCLLINGNAAAAKLRQLLPRIALHLAAKGWKITSIRLKILQAVLSHRI